MGQRCLAVWWTLLSRRAVSHKLSSGNVILVHGERLRQLEVIFELSFVSEKGSGVHDFVYSASEKKSAQS